MFAGFSTDESTLRAIESWVVSLSEMAEIPDMGSLTNIHDVYFNGKDDVINIGVIVNYIGKFNHTAYRFYSNGKIACIVQDGELGDFYPIENLTFTIYGLYPKVVPQWVSAVAETNNGGQGKK